MRINVIEDDKVFNKLIEHTLKLNPDYEVQSYFNGKDFIRNLSDNPDVVTLDLGLPDYTGNEILKKIKRFNPEIDVIVISGQDDISTAVQLLKEGAYDYITKDENIKERLLHSIQNIKKNKNLKNEISQLKTEIGNKYEYRNAIIGDSPAIKAVFALIDKAIKVPNINVSVYGETGTGKELIAKTIHYNSPRKDSPFIAVNMGAIPKELIESELFGHEKGAFTGAITAKKGKFEEADGGTIFLDEIGEMDLNLQVKLLRVLQEREITRVGGNAVIKINTRIITATNRDLAEEVREGNFREDLYYRLLGLPIHLPPLKDRRNDTIMLTQHFLNTFCKDNGLDKLELTSAAKKKILSHRFPGNVRELKAVVELGAVMTNSNIIDEEHIMFNSTQSEEDIFNEEMTLKEYTERIIRHYLKKYNNNVLQVADKLDMGKSTIYNLLKKDKETK
ncbi:sigma-54-dependent transcriptional regulator [Carboxylicivirga linearis]|uniref:Sigma-54-dependent Fis family transcriptional regulator n=1 Tax=Carboxylicivirga linearis TaxID=1628157 RepID=A0ABS5JTB8_9BACT|nr:sigma-54 dependent transcriptional regulator [Carboxylicivirga linearis]MBS2097779.1 sigma-54-dependent Fis family transcriptional regulator [Carboxylicivirga linearis]